MPRLPHGASIFTGLHALDTLAEIAPAASPADSQSEFKNYGFLFADLQRDSQNLLPQSRTTRDCLVQLGSAMRDSGNEAAGDSFIPSAYTYFGQFVDHDITLDEVSAPLPRLMDPELIPLTPDEIRCCIRNRRTAILDLGSVYDAPAERDGDRMKLGEVSPIHRSVRKPFLRPPGKSNDNDLPREGRSSDIEHDRAALIGDPRNDENVIINQLHLAFLRAHNRLIDQGNSSDSARTILRRHYQHIVVHDFLKRIADPLIVDNVLIQNRHYHVFDRPFFLPLEFTVAAYRFGHSMVRAEYDFNLNFNSSGEPGTQPARLQQLFTFTALSGNVGGFKSLPENWIVEWENFVEGARPFNKARRIDTKLVEPLFHLPDLGGIPIGEENGARLAVRNLLRGYLLRIPTGQAVARAVGAIPLGPERIIAAAANSEQAGALHAGGFLDRTPLWYYILAEAADSQTGRLGTVGSILVSEVLIGLVRRSEDSILRDPAWSPSLGPTTGEFNLHDLLRFAGVLNA